MECTQFRREVTRVQAWAGRGLTICQWQQRPGLEGVALWGGSKFNAEHAEFEVAGGGGDQQPGAEQRCGRGVSPGRGQRPRALGAGEDTQTDRRTPTLHAAKGESEGRGQGSRLQ